jgi:hypothetical protein
VIRVYDEAGNVIETHEHAGNFKSGEVRRQLRVSGRSSGLWHVGFGAHTHHAILCDSGTDMHANAPPVLRSLTLPLVCFLRLSLQATTNSTYTYLARLALATPYLLFAAHAAM